MKNFFSHDPKLLFYGFLIVFFASYGQTFFISLFNTDIREFYILSDGEFGFVYAISTLCSSFILISFAKLIDHIDLRTYSLIVTIGLLLACFGMVMLVDHILYLFLIIFMLRFFGQGAMTHAGETTMARYFGKNRGKALSVATLGGMAGVMFLPLYNSKLF
jgi:Major Facilitator Superfamily.